MGADVTEKGWGGAYQTESRDYHGRFGSGGSAKPKQPATASQSTGGQQPVGHNGSQMPGQQRPVDGIPDQSLQTQATAGGGQSDSTNWAHEPGMRHEALRNINEAQDIDGQVKDLRAQRAQLQQTMQSARENGQSQTVNVQPGEGNPAEGSQQTWGQYVSGLIQQQEHMDLQINQLESRSGELRQQAHLLMQSSKTVTPDTKETDVAATLTGSGELTTFSFPIEKTEETADGNLIVYGKATDGSVDSDEQIVDPGFAGKAIRDWLDSGGNLRVQHNAQRDPAGVGLEATAGADGATWVKGLIVEPTAIRLVKHGALRAYSVGIARPTIERDRVARGGRITDGQIVEISLVDRPANKNCGIQLVKSDKEGAPEYTGKMFGSEDVIEKAGGGAAQSNQIALTPPAQTMDTLPTQSIPTPTSQTPPSELDDLSDPGDEEDVQKLDTIDVVVKVNPMDVAKMVARRVVRESTAVKVEVNPDIAKSEFAALAPLMDADQVVKDHREFNTERRTDLANQGHALPDGSYPIPDKDALRRAAILARSGHGNVTAARRLIASRAKDLGVANPLEEASKSEALELVEKGATCPVCNGTGKLDGKPCTKCDGAMKADGINQHNADDNDADSDGDAYDGGEMNKATKKKGKKGKKSLPPWLQDKKDDDEGDDKKADKADAADEGEDDEEVFNHKSSVPTAGVVGQTSDPVPAHREPDGPYMELFERSAHMTDGDNESHAVPVELKAAMRLKSLNVPAELGTLHDLTCAAYSPDDLAKCYPSADFTGINEQYFAEKALNSASMDTLAEAANATMLWNHARTLKMAGTEVLGELQAEAHKAFQDANPGPGSAPTPHEIHATRYNRPYITAGHAAASPGQKPPTSAGHVPSGQIDASQFSRGPLDSGHAEDSPSNKGVGVPTTMDYVPTIKDNARQAMRAMHDHISQTFPDVCCMNPDDHEGITGKPVPVPVGHGTPPASAVKAEDEAAIEKGLNKKMRKKLGKKVLAGKMTVDEARSKIGRMNAQKTTKPAAEEMVEPEMTKSEEPVEVAKAVEPDVTKMVEPDVEKGILTPDVVKSFLDTLSLRMEEQNAKLAEYNTQLETRLEAQEKMIKKQNKSLEAANVLLNSMADQPDPNVAAFKGMAQNPIKQASARPAGAQSVAEVAERTQAMMLRELESEFRSSPDPSRREAAWQSMLKMRGINQ